MHAMAFRRVGLALPKSYEEQGADRDLVESYMPRERAHVGNHNGFKHSITPRDNTLSREGGPVGMEVDK